MSQHGLVVSYAILTHFRPCCDVYLSRLQLIQQTHALVFQNMQRRQVTAIATPREGRYNTVTIAPQLFRVYAI